jgi:RNA polymerase sigma factor (sigma-70 family)
VVAPANVERDAMAVENRRLVFSQARQFVGLKTLTYDELVSEGDMALLRAARTWPNNGSGKFSTYAVTSIKRAMLKAIKRRPFFGQEPLDQPDGAWLDTLPAAETINPDNDEKPAFDLGVVARCLTPTEAHVVSAIYGLEGPTKRVNELATELKMPADLVRQLHDSALASLRAALADRSPDDAGHRRSGL